MSVRDDVKKVYNQTQQELNDNEERKIARKEKIESHPAYIFVSDLYNQVKDAFDYWKLRRYDAKTQRMIKKIPKKMIQSAKKGYYGMHIYAYECQGYFGAVWLREDMAKSYLDRRGKHIIEYLEKEGIEYDFKASNGMSPYYAIRVYF